MTAAASVVSNRLVSEGILTEGIEFSAQNMAQFWSETYEENEHVRGLMHRIARDTGHNGTRLEVDNAVALLIHLADSAMTMMINQYGHRRVLSPQANEISNTSKAIELIFNEMLHDLNEAYLEKAFAKAGLSLSESGARITEETVEEPEELADWDLTHVAGAKIFSANESGAAKYRQRVKYIKFRKN